MIRITLTAKGMTELSEAYGNVSLEYIWKDLLRIEASSNYKEYNEKNKGELHSDMFRIVKQILEDN